MPSMYSKLILHIIIAYISVCHCTLMESSSFTVKMFCYSYITPFLDRYKTTRNSQTSPRKLLPVRLNHSDTELKIDIFMALTLIC